MRRSNVKKVLNALHELQKEVGCDMELAVFMYQRYGDIEGIEDDQLNDIQEILDSSETLFDSNLLEDVEEVLGY